MGTDVAIAIPPEIAPIEQVLRHLFPDHSVAVERDWVKIYGHHDLSVVLLSNESEFPCGLDISAKMVTGREFEAWLRGLARELSLYFDARSICDGSPYGDTPSPYWSLVWDRGKPMLAGDLDTMLGDGQGGPVTIVRELPPDSVMVPGRADLRAWLKRKPP